MWQRHSYWLKGGGGGEANLGATAAHPEGADSGEGVVEVVLRHFHRSHYGSSPLWFFYGEGL
jgi:hypothetical protein